MSIEKDYSFMIWMLMGAWLMTIGFFLDGNYIFHTLDLDAYEVRSWTSIALSATAGGCFIAAIVKSIKNMRKKQVADLG